MSSLRSHYFNNVAVGDTITFNSQFSTLNFAFIRKITIYIIIPYCLQIIKLLPANLKMREKLRNSLKIDEII